MNYKKVKVRSEDIKFYTGFPDYPTLIEFWKYVEPSACNLTYFSYVRDNNDSINLGNHFPYLGDRQKKFAGSNVGCGRTLQPIDEFWLFLTRLRLGLLERDLAFRFNISEQVRYNYYMGQFPVFDVGEPFHMVFERTN